MDENAVEQHSQAAESNGVSSQSRPEMNGTRVAVQGATPATRRSPMSVAVIGGGITGLAAAHRLRELSPDAKITVWESKQRLGGILETSHRDDFLIERSADMFTTRDPWALSLCQRLGIEDELINTNSQHRRAFVVKRGRLIPVPPGFTLMAPTRIWPIIRTPLVSWPGKMRMAAEFCIRSRRDDADESLASFARRRLGKEAFEQLIQPLVGGIYTADPEKLSMNATMQQFVEMERRHGGLIRGIRRGALKQRTEAGKASGARYGLFVAPRDGMQRLVDALIERLDAARLELQRAVQSLSQLPLANGHRAWQLEFENGDKENVDAVIVSTPSPVSARLVGPTAPELSSRLSRIEHAGASVVVFGVRRDQIGHALDGFGFVVPHKEGRRILAGSFSSVKFPGRAPEGKVLLRVFVGGACQPELLELDDQEVTDLAWSELTELIGASGKPLFSEVVRWHKAMPQYHVGHLERVADIERRVADLPAFELCGNAYRGVGVPFCVRDGEQAAERLLGVEHGSTDQGD